MCYCCFKGGIVYSHNNFFTIIHSIHMMGFLMTWEIIVVKIEKNIIKIV